MTDIDLFILAFSPSTPSLRTILNASVAAPSMSNGPLSAMAKGLGKKAFPLLQDNMLHWGRDLTAQAVIDIEGIRRESQEVQSSQWSISELIETENAMRTSKAGLTGEV